VLKHRQEPVFTEPRHERIAAFPGAAAYVRVHRSAQCHTSTNSGAADLCVR
jgi:hypothetical protein